MPTLNEIVNKAKELGLPDDYPLRGTKEHKANQIKAYLQVPLNWAAITDVPENQNDRYKLKEFEKFCLGA